MHLDLLVAAWQLHRVIGNAIGNAYCFQRFVFTQKAVMKKKKFSHTQNMW